MRTHVLILAGGRGQRFWPLSRSRRPKQVLPLLGSETLFERTVARAREGSGDDGALWGVAAEDLGSVLRAQSPTVRPDRWIWEPVSRNTAPAIVAATAVIAAAAREAGEPDPRILVLPADHWIPDSGSFWASVREAESIVDRFRRIVAFGVPASRPETGYGYIERGAALSGAGFEVARFHEKPDAATAARYLEAGGFSWNAGIFLFSARQLLAESAAHVPELGDLVRGLEARLSRRGVPAVLADRDGWMEFFRAAPSISIDYAVMERSRDVAVVEAGFAWDDLGSWSSWGDHAERDVAGNRVQGALVAIDARENVVYSEEGGLVALLGVEGLVVVRVGDATLVCPRERVQEVRKLVEEGGRAWPERFR